MKRNFGVEVGWNCGVEVDQDCGVYVRKNAEKCGKKRKEMRRGNGMLLEWKWVRIAERGNGMRKEAEEGGRKWKEVEGSGKKRKYAEICGRSGKRRKWTW